MTAPLSRTPVSTVFTSYVDGATLPPAGAATALLDPANGRTWAVAHADPAGVEAAAASAVRAFADPAWRDLGWTERAVLLRRLGNAIAANAAELGGYETLQNGKPIPATTAEMRAAAQWFHYFASLAETHEDRHRSLSRTAEALVVREPVGVVVAITPFNGALSLGSWKLAPALAAGNAVILKPPADAPASSIRLAQLALEAGIPPGVVNVVIGGAEEGAALVADPRVAMVSFTGSTATARHVGALAAGNLKRFVCEAGGKSAHIVFEDACLEDAVIAATQGAFSATGQTCVAGSRVLVHETIADRFLALYLASIARLRVGDPRAERTHIGPVASARQRDKIAGFVDEAVAAGARVLCGGRAAAPEGTDPGGFWFEPTVIAGVTASDRICREEIFGPVVTVQTFATEDEAVALANGTDYGLAAGFWTRDLARVQRLRRRLESGTVWVNTYRLIDRRVPFGGIKQSGLGRENGPEGLDEFTRIKAVVTDHGCAVDPFAA